MAEPDEEPTPSSASNLTCWASGIRFRDTIERAANILESYSAAIVRARAMNKNLDRNDQSTYRLRYESPRHPTTGRTKRPGSAPRPTYPASWRS